MRGNGTDSPQNGGYRSVISRGLPTRWTTVTTTFGELGRDGKKQQKKQYFVHSACIDLHCAFSFSKFYVRGLLLARSNGQWVTLTTVQRQAFYIITSSQRIHSFPPPGDVLNSSSC